MNVPQCRTAQTNGSRHVCQPTFHQYNICCINGNVCSGADRNTHISSGQCRCIVDAVADHCHFAQCGQLPNDGFLAVRQYAGNDMIDTSLFSDRPGGLFIVAGEHDHLNAHALQLANRLRTFLFQHVCHGDDSQKLVITGKEQRCFSGFRQHFRLLLYFLRNGRRLGDTAGIAAVEHLPVPLCCQTVSHQSLKFSDRRSGNLVFFAIL